MMAAGVYEVGVLYEALAEHRNWTPDQVDEMELWQCAVALGVLKGDDPEAGRSPDSEQERRYEVMRQRVRAEQGQAPMPEARPVTPDLMRHVGESLA